MRPAELGFLQDQNISTYYFFVVKKKGWGCQWSKYKLSESTDILFLSNKKLLIGFSKFFFEFQSLVSMVLQH